MFNGPRREAPIYGQIRENLNPQLINPGLLAKGKELMIFLLPETERAETMQVLESVPMPVITIDKGMPSIFRGGFPADYGLNIDGKLHTTRFNARMMTYILEVAGVDYDLSDSRNVRHYNDFDTPEGGTMVLDQRGRKAITSIKHWVQRLDWEGFETLYLPPEHVVSLGKQYPDDWVYQLYQESDLAGEPLSNAHIDPLVTVFSRSGESPVVWVDELLLPKIEDGKLKNWNPKAVAREKTMQGVLNLAFIGDRVFAPGEKAMEGFTLPLQDAGFTVHHFPQANISQRAGLKCRTLTMTL